MILLSGGFDPIHPGHVNMIRAASAYGPVCIALNSDDWLIRKKGFFFQPWIDRAHILRALRWVHCVEPVDDSDGSVCKAIEVLKPQYFGNGGDRTANNTPELELCQKLGVEPVFGLGGDKWTSSSFICTKNLVQREWGHYTVIDEGEGYKVKKLTVAPGKRTSTQRHKWRTEYWIAMNGWYRIVMPGEWHQIENNGEEPLTIIEVQIGRCEEADIERV